MTPKKRTRQFAALLIASALSVSVSNSAVASAEEFQDHGAKGGFASGVMAELLGQVLWSGVIVLCPSGWVMR